MPHIAKNQIAALRRIFNCAVDLFYDFWVKSLAGMKWDNNADIVFKIDTVASFASHKRKAGFKKKLLRFI